MEELKPNELQLGNLVHIKNYDAKWCKVILIGKYKIGHESPLLDHEESKIEDLEPIKLTEDILLKCGFKLSTPNQYINHQHWYNEDTDIEFNHELVCRIYEGNGYVYVNYIKYLHQLQNLHFALTGKELDPKL